MAKMSQEVSYRELKEQFVSHQNGTSVTEVAIVAANAPIVTFANIVACHVLFQTACCHVWYVHYSQSGSFADANFLLEGWGGTGNAETPEL